MPQLLTSLYLAAYAAWFALLGFLSSRPIPELPTPSFSHSDKLAHFTYFFAGSLVLGLALRQLFPLLAPARVALALVAAAAAVGLLDEWHQSFVPLRQGLDPLDFLADALGGAAAALLLARLHHHPLVAPRRPHQTPTTTPS